jgi:hypothetical protein
VRALSALKPLVLWLVICAAAFEASAQDAGAPPAPPQNPLPGTPPTAPAGSGIPADLQACLQETGDYVTHGKTVDYVIGITNTCNARLRCEVFANVTGVRGTTLGHTVMILAPASSGAGAKKTYVMAVKAAGGIVQVSRECKVL